MRGKGIAVKATIFGLLLLLLKVNYGYAQVIPDWITVESNPFSHLTVPEGISNPVISAQDITDVSAKFVADPFLFYENGMWYMFFEVYDDYGKIGLATSSDGLQWHYEQIVLDDGYHHSYPMVLKYDDRYYLIPESFLHKDVHVYEATDFPFSWHYVSTIVSGKYFADPSIFRYNNTWWMFISETHSRNCYLYYSDDLLSGWVEHPMSPIISNDASKARPGGRPIVFDNGRILRVTQKDDTYYGEKLRVFEVDVLTRQEYAEHEIPESPILDKSGHGWNASGMHQCDCWWAGDKWLCSVDGQNEWEWSIGIYIGEALYTVTPAAGLHGSINPSTPQTVNHGSAISFTVTPDEGYHIEGVTGCGGTLNGNEYTTGPITGNCTVMANFAINTYTVIPVVIGSGSIDPSTPQIVDYGSNISFTLSPGPGYHIAFVTGTCGGTLTVNTYETAPVITDCSVIPNFEINTYIITTLSEPHGSITCTPNPVNYEEDSTCDVIPGTGYHVDTVTVDGGPATLTDGKYIFSNVTSNHAIGANFTAYTKVKLLKPNGGEKIPSGSTYSIRWGAPPKAVKFKLERSMDNGLTWIMVADNITGASYEWSVPKPWGDKKLCLLRVAGYDASGAIVGADISDAPFMIQQVKLTSPNGGDTLKSSTTHTITWTTDATKKSVAKVKLYYTKDGGITWIFITKLTGNPGSHLWTVPRVAKTKSNCKVRVELIDADGNVLSRDASDGFFTIQS